MRLEMPQTKNKSDNESRELNFIFPCYYFMNIYRYTNADLKISLCVLNPMNSRGMHLSSLYFY